MGKRYLLGISVLLALALVVPLAAQAAVVGRFTHVEGYVDLLKQGKLPAVPVKVKDPVEPGDVIRTKSKSKAQVQFVDDSFLTMAPESRVAVADYVFDPAKNERRAVLKVFRGLTHTAVKFLLQVQEPDFTVQTLTAVIGVRGTEWYTLLKPNATNIYLLQGLLGVVSINPDIPGVLMLAPGRFTQVPQDRPPLPARPFTGADLDLLKKLMDSGVPDVARFELPGEGPALPTARMPITRPGDPESGIFMTVPPIYSPASPSGSPGSPSGPGGTVPPGTGRIIRGN